MFFSDVHSGDRVVRTAVQENAVRHLLNSGAGLGDGFYGRARQSNICVSVFNSGNVALPAGCGVQIVQGSSSEPFPVLAVSDTGKFYGVLVQRLEPGMVGSMIVSGIADLRVMVSGEFAVPAGTTWEPGANGLIVLNPGSGSALAVIGGALNGTRTNFVSYKTGVGWTVSAGYVRCGTAEVWHDNIVVGIGKWLYATMAYNSVSLLWSVEFIASGEIEEAQEEQEEPIIEYPHRKIAEIKTEDGNSRTIVLHEGDTIDIVGYVGE